ncbi:MAG TPA: extracellular solute-binding protein [Herpetosiphonaceae bacterium]
MADHPSRQPRPLSRRSFLRAGALGAASLLAACDAQTDTPTPPPATAEAESALDRLVAAARREGALNTIALPRDWLNYGQLIDSFTQTYGIAVNELNPEAGSGEELDALRAARDGDRAAAPDVIDVGFAFGPIAQREGLLQPYKVAVWETIPGLLKDPDGYWYGDYYGVLSFAVNRRLVADPPRDWADLLRPEHKGQVALAGDPRSSSQAIQTIYAAALANGGSLDDAGPGLEFFAALQQAGNLVPLVGDRATLGDGRTPILLTWDYLSLSARDAMAGQAEIDTIVPASGIFGGGYIQAISAFAAHPNAARLWMEFIYSDAGQLAWLRGYGHPVRYNDLVRRNAIPADLAASLPPADQYARAEFPTLYQLTAAQQLITERWDQTVGVAIKPAD